MDQTGSPSIAGALIVWPAEEDESKPVLAATDRLVVARDDRLGRISFDNQHARNAWDCLPS